MRLGRVAVTVTALNTNDTGFHLTASDQLTYDKWLARTAHRLGLSIALKNDLDQARQLEPYFD
jgi:hypothetical protein